MQLSVRASADGRSRQRGCSDCPEMDTEIRIGPTGRQLLPLSVV